MVLEDGGAGIKQIPAQQGSFQTWEEDPKRQAHEDGVPQPQEAPQAPSLCHHPLTLAVGMEELKPRSRQSKCSPKQPAAARGSPLPPALIHLPYPRAGAGQELPLCLLTRSRAGGSRAGVPIPGQRGGGMLKAWAEGFGGGQTGAFCTSSEHLRQHGAGAAAGRLGRGCLIKCEGLPSSSPRCSLSDFGKEAFY